MKFKAICFILYFNLIAISIAIPRQYKSFKDSNQNLQNDFNSEESGESYKISKSEKKFNPGEGKSGVTEKSLTLRDLNFGNNYELLEDILYGDISKDTSESSSSENRKVRHTCTKCHARKHHYARRRGHHVPHDKHHYHSYDKHHHNPQKYHHYNPHNYHHYPRTYRHYNHKHRRYPHKHHNNFYGNKYPVNNWSSAGVGGCTCPPYNSYQNNYNQNNQSNCPCSPGIIHSNIPIQKPPFNNHHGQGSSFGISNGYIHRYPNYQIPQRTFLKPNYTITTTKPLETSTSTFRIPTTSTTFRTSTIPPTFSTSTTPRTTTIKVTTATPITTTPTITTFSTSTTPVTTTIKVTTTTPITTTSNVKTTVTPPSSTKLPQVLPDQSIATTNRSITIGDGIQVDFSNIATEDDLQNSIYLDARNLDDLVV